MKRSTELHVLHNVGPLSFIWSDYSNLLWLDSSTKKTCGNLLHIGSFSPVKQTCLEDISVLLETTYTQKNQVNAKRLYFVCTSVLKF